MPDGKLINFNNSLYCGINNLLQPIYNNGKQLSYFETIYPNLIYTDVFPESCSGMSLSYTKTFNFTFPNNILIYWVECVIDTPLSLYFTFKNGSTNKVTIETTIKDNCNVAMIGFSVNVTPSQSREIIEATDNSSIYIIEKSTNMMRNIISQSSVEYNTISPSIVLTIKSTFNDTMQMYWDTGYVTWKIKSICLA